MEGHIVGGQIGPEAQWDLEFKEGKLCAKAVYDGAEVAADLVVKIKAAAVLDAIKKAIPGEIDDAIIDKAKTLIGA